MSPGQKRVAKKRTHIQSRVGEPETQPTTKQLKEQKKKLKEDLNDLLDEVDKALEENMANAEEFMSNWIQKGGQ